MFERNIPPPYSGQETVYHLNQVFVEIMKLSYISSQYFIILAHNVSRMNCLFHTCTFEV